MTHDDWTLSNSPRDLLNFCQGKGSSRQFRLFGCACCRRIWHLLTDERCREAVWAAEAFEDKLISVREFDATRLPAAEAVKQSLGVANLHPIWADVLVGKLRIQTAPWAAMVLVSRVVEMTSHGNIPMTEVESVFSETAIVVANLAAMAISYANGTDAKIAEQTAQADLVRHIFGNPFTNSRPVNRQSERILELARRAYNGDLDSVNGLASDLKKAGEKELAEHFSAPFHPKGCWVLDRLLAS